ncbi:MAG TPA: filamentous hemagglutinin N-terminal domain-containing protein, partial [Chthoniobacteraceae bacterium]
MSLTLKLRLPRKRALAFGALWALTQTIPARGGGVHLDGSLGQSGALPGPNYLIPAEAGKQAGGNLFHSFSQFDISNGEVATFLAPANPNAPAINNILARITSGSASSIDGTIRSDISGANLFLINPNGFMFGAHASLDISGSFTATSASTVKLSDGAHFDAHPGSGDLTLSSAPVSAFGFVATSTTQINVASTLSVPTGQSLSLIGGHNINITAAHLSAPSGQIAIVSNSSASDVSVDLKSPHPTGAINESAGSILDASGPTGGKIVIRAGALTLQGASQAFATTEGSGGGGGINVKVTGTTTVKGQSRLFTLTTGAGTAGNLKISSGTLNVTNSSVLGSQATNTAASTARAGDVNIFAGNIGLFDESEIAAASFGAGRPGNMTIVAKNLTMSLGFTAQGQTGEEIADITDENGSGNLRLYIADKLSISNGASISTSTFGQAKGGDLTVSAGDIYIANSGTIPFSLTETGIFADSSGTGRGGDIHLKANNVTIASGGLISTRALSSGNGGTT